MAKKILNPEKLKKLSISDLTALLKYYERELESARRMADRYDASDETKEIAIEVETRTAEIASAFNRKLKELEL